MLDCTYTNRARGRIDILKTNDAGTVLAGVRFDLYTDAAPLGGTRGAEDTPTGLFCVTSLAGVCSIPNIVPGQYWVVEDVLTVPPGHNPAPDQNVMVAAGQTLSLTFVNPRQTGAIRVTKTRKHAAAGPGDHPHSGVSFTVNGVTKATDTNGVACFDGLTFGPYDVTESLPAGYVADGPLTKSVTVDNHATCAGDPYGGESVAFSNTPLTNLTVTVDSQVDGGTASTINCGDPGDPVSTDPNGDGSKSKPNLPPGTYTCVVVIDP